MKKSRYEAIVIGASSGGLAALQVILPNLPESFSLPIIVVVHMSPTHPSVLALLLAEKSKLLVKEAEDKEPVQPGNVYIAPSDYHLLVEPTRHLSLCLDKPRGFSRPSIDLLFESAADAYRNKLVGLLLTGANHDGARGLKKIENEGGLALVQAPASAESPIMPEAALQACNDAHTLELTGIAEFLQGLEAH